MVLNRCPLFFADMEQHKSIWLFAVSCCFASRNLCIYMFFFWAAATTTTTTGTGDELQNVVFVWAAFGNSFVARLAAVPRRLVGNILLFGLLVGRGQWELCAISGDKRQKTQLGSIGTWERESIGCIWNSKLLPGEETKEILLISLWHFTLTFLQQ